MNAIAIAERCLQCGDMLPPPKAKKGPRRLYCSGYCRHRWFDRHGKRGPLPEPEPEEEDLVPESWDGTTQYSRPPEMALRWRVFCICCGRGWFVEARASQVTAIAHLGHCDVCGGTRWIEEDYGDRELREIARSEQASGDALDGPRAAVAVFNWWRK